MIDFVRTGRGNDWISASQTLEQLLSTEFQQLANTLSDGAFAAYLLAYDTAREENAAKMAAINFAEGDDDPDLAERIGKKGKISFDLRFDVPPQEAIDFFKSKKALPPDEFYALEAEARSGAFTISKVYRLDVTTALQKELISALENGTPQPVVIKRLQAILDGAGHKQLGTHHLETVFRTTMQMAYGVGRRRAMEEVTDYLPIWEYSAVGDDRTRPTHRALDGTQHPADHPFWNKYYPPWDFRCRCTVIATFDYRSGYDRTRPNPGTVVEYGTDDMPRGANVDGTPVRIDASKFVGVPRQLGLGDTLKAAGQRALDSRR